jgi:predicted acyltransferase
LYDSRLTLNGGVGRGRVTTIAMYRPDAGRYNRRDGLQARRLEIRDRVAVSYASRQMAAETTVVVPDVARDTARPAGASARLVSLDAFRGATMLFMAAEILRIPQVARKFPGSAIAGFFASTMDHREWVGCAPWDLIQPSFMFMVGVALPFSIARRTERGETFGRQFGHSVYRALILIALGIFLRSQARPQTYFTFEDVLTQIGLGYVFLFLLAWTRPRTQWIAAALILIGYWAAFALYPLPPAGFDTTTVGVPLDWPHHLSGFAAHWDKNTNFASRADQWFLNLFPREKPFVYNGGGYLTLNFVPSLATMIFGLLTGELLRTNRAGHEKARALAVYGTLGIGVGAALHLLGVCPLVKRIWTPSWTIFSAGWAALILAGVYYIVDVRQQRGWTLPFVVVGMNSIAMYCLVHVATDYTIGALQIHLGRRMFESFGRVFAPVLLGGTTLVIFWLVLLWMYRRKVFLRI